MDIEFDEYSLHIAFFTYNYFIFKLKNWNNQDYWHLLHSFVVLISNSPPLFTKN